MDEPGRGLFLAESGNQRKAALNSKPTFAFRLQNADRTRMPCDIVISVLNRNSNRKGRMHPVFGR